MAGQGGGASEQGSGQGQMCPGTGSTMEPAAPLPWMEAKASQCLHCHADALPTAPTPSGPTNDPESWLEAGAG